MMTLFFPFHLMTMNVEEIKTTNGLNFWFVEDNSVPIISLSFNFSGGAFFDKKEGTSSFVSALLDEGAGSYNSEEFQTRMDKLGMKLNFSSSRDSISGTFQTISKNKSESFKLLKLIFSNPRFDEQDIDKIRNQIIASLKINQSNISDIANQEFHKNFFADHSFSKNPNGTIESVIEIKKKDISEYFKNFITKSNLVMGVSGDVSKEEIKKLMEETFSNLPLTSNNLTKISSKKKFPKGTKFIEKDTPQASIIFAQKGVSRKDKDFFSARIANYVLGGGGFQSRLYKNIREKEGLVYSIYSYLVPYVNNDLLFGGFQTTNENVDKTIELVKNEWDLIATKGISNKKLKDAKSYYKGSFTRNLTSTSSISSLLRTVQLYGLDKNYFQERNNIIDNITLKDVNNIAKMIFNSDELYFVVVGKMK